MTIINVLTALVATYAAILSTINVYTQMKAKRWHLLVTCYGGWEGEIETLLARAVNIGERPIAPRHPWFQGRERKGRLGGLMRDFSPRRLLPVITVRWKGFLPQTL